MVAQCKSWFCSQSRGIHGWNERIPEDLFAILTPANWNCWSCTAPHLDSPHPSARPLLFHFFYFIFLFFLFFFFWFSGVVVFGFFLFCFDQSFHSSTFSHVKQLYNLFVVMHDWLQTILTSLWILQRGRGWGVGISFPKFVSGCKLSSNLESCVILCVCFWSLRSFYHCS